MDYFTVEVPDEELSSLLENEGNESNSQINVIVDDSDPDAIQWSNGWNVTDDGRAGYLATNHVTMTLTANATAIFEYEGKSQVFFFGFSESSCEILS